MLSACSVHGVCLERTSGVHEECMQYTRSLQTAQAICLVYMDLPHYPDSNNVAYIVACIKSDIKKECNGCSQRANGVDRNREPLLVHL